MEIDGIILIDKPSALTSHQVVDVIRHKLGIRRVGHAGTLDPLATGLLVIMIGRATKLSNSLLQEEKSYQVKMQLFIATDSGDITGKVIANETPAIPSLTEIKQAINSFNHREYYQTPPLFSAIKIKGKKLYQYARQGLAVTVPPRLVQIKEIELLDYQPDKSLIEFRVKCSKGTYVRSLVSDIAQQLKTVATVTSLRRLSSGNFSLEQAVSLEEVAKEKIANQMISLADFMK
jgi:tRNA pseudouridine55 synthase